MLLNCFNQVVNLTNQNYVFEAAMMVFLQHQILIKANRQGQVKQLIPINFILPTKSRARQPAMQLDDLRSFWVVSSQGTMEQTVKFETKSHL